MSTAEDGRASHESSAAAESFCKRFFRPEINEDPQNVTQEAMQNNSTGASEVSTIQGGNLGSISGTVGKSELEQLLRQMTFTRSEAERLMALVHSRIMEDSPSPLLSLETSSTSGSLTRHKHGDESHNFHAAIVSSRVLEEEIASPADLANVFKGSMIGSGQAPRQDLMLIDNDVTLKASPQHPTSMENLPDELLVNIFIRLFAKQLAQMRSVSTSWNALLSQYSFVKSHLHHSLHNNDQILLVFYVKDNSSSDSKQFTTHSCRSPHLQLTDFIKLPVNPRPGPGYINGLRIIGSVNGLICSCYGDSVIHIWNPSLSAVFTLPPYSTPSCDYHTIRSYFRFGFDPKTDDYKVVKLTGFTGLPEHPVKWWMDVEIYSMRKGSWKLITERPPSHITGIYDEDLVCGYGHLHWLGLYFTEKAYTDTIVAFDLGSETFSQIPLPDSILNDNNYRHNMLGLLAGKLCAISQFKDGTSEVWVMEEYGVADSWVKRHVFSHFIGDIVPYGFTSRSEFLIDDNNRFVLYDPVAKKSKIFEKVCFKRGWPDKIVEYVDSLVWVGPAEI